jgi:hypothetical protein
MVVGKRGEELTTPVLLSLVLTILVFSINFIFVHQSSSGALIYEKVYAKQIAFLLDGAREGTDLEVDVSKALKIAQNNEVREEALAKIIQIDPAKNLVKVSLRGGNVGQSMKYFSNYTIIYGIQGEKLIMRIRGMQNE